VPEGQSARLPRMPGILGQSDRGEWSGQPRYPARDVPTTLAVSTARDGRDARGPTCPADSNDHRHRTARPRIQWMLAGLRGARPSLPPRVTLASAPSRLPLEGARVTHKPAPKATSPYSPLPPGARAQGPKRAAAERQHGPRCNRSRPRRGAPVMRGADSA